MPVRKKSKFEQWFSFSRHQRRFGAEKIYAQFGQADLNQLKNTIIDGDQIQYTHGSAKDLNEHIEQLKQVFLSPSIWFTCFLLSLFGIKVFATIL